MSDELTIVVPTRDGAPYAFVIADAYRRAGLAPRFLVDGRSSSHYRAEALAGIESAAILEVTQPGDFIEAMLPEIARLVTSKWLFRFDDDEFPSSALIAWLPQGVARATRNVIAAPRRNVAIIDGVPCFAGSVPELLAGDDQCRGFRVEAARFSPELHSPGLELKMGDVADAPADCFIYHFDWIVRSRDERARKLARYQAISGEPLARFRYQYLFEDFDRALYAFTPVDDPIIADLALRLHEARLSHTSTLSSPA